MAEEVRVFSYADIPVKLCYFCRNFYSEICYLPKKNGVKVQILQNDKKVDVCVEMQTELW